MISVAGVRWSANRIGRCGSTGAPFMIRPNQPVLVGSTAGDCSSSKWGRQTLLATRQPRGATSAPRPGPAGGPPQRRQLAAGRLAVGREAMGIDPKRDTVAPDVGKGRAGVG